MATVVNLSKGNSYKLLALVTSLFVWCMSDAPHVFDGKTCVRDELINVVQNIWVMVVALMTSLLMWCISSVPRLYNRMSAHDKSMCNKEDTLHIKLLLTKNVCVHTCTHTRM